MAVLYPECDRESLVIRLEALAAEFRGPHDVARREEPFDETDVVLITYGDQVREPATPPLRTLHDFLRRRFAGVVTGVHVLPFFPSTSDDGFAVADYLAVDSELGLWEDVRALGEDFRLMVDAVFNHTSASNAWFRRWCAGDPAFEGFYVTADPSDDWSGVTRPRPHPLLHRFQTARGEEHVWTTFSADQVDLDYSNPDVLLAMTGVLLEYVESGAGIVRLDAVAYLWKERGTACIHHEKTHEVIRLWRTLLDAVAPGTLLITETNVPHRENVSYFGDGHDEAHLVYQFPLAPLVLSAFHLADATTLTEWADALSTPSETTTFLNFLGSHDGIGVRPVEGILTQAEIGQLLELAKAHGGGVSWKVNADGSLSPYELNAVYFDALTEVDSAEPMETQVRRFLSAQSILLALAGVPAIYVHALLGSRNWVEGVEQTGHLRAINRQKLEREELERELDDPRSLRHMVTTRLSRRIRVRTGERAFHPNGPQRVLRAGPKVFGFEREAPDGSSALVCLHSVSGRREDVDLGPEDGLTLRGRFHDLCAERVAETDAHGRLRLALPPYGVAWLRRDQAAWGSRGRRGGQPSALDST
jgi:glycosidase